MKGILFATAVVLCAVTGCSGSTASGDSTLSAVKSYLVNQFAGWSGALLSLQAAAPVGRSWDAEKDMSALADMRAQWRKAHSAYQAIASSVGPVIPDLNATMDASYDDQLSPIPDGDADPFDDMGVIGMHAVERILYADRIPPPAVDRERPLLGYAPPAFPSNARTAAEFHDQLLGKLIRDIHTMAQQFMSFDLDLGFVTKSIGDILQADLLKVYLASGPGNEESRYSHSTLADVRAGVAAAEALWSTLEGRVKLVSGGAALAASVRQGLSRLDATLNAVTGDAVPDAPETWNFAAPIPADFMTPYGKLYVGFRNELDGQMTGSLAASLNAAADALRSDVR